MSNDEHDPLLRRAIDELRQLPPVDPEAIRRVVVAAAAARLSPADEPVFVVSRGRSIRIWSALGMAAAAAIIGFVARGAWTARTPDEAAQTTASAPATTVASVRAAAANAAESAPILEQFMLDNPRARSVAVVGDFNEWDPSKARMTRSSETAPWSVIIPIVPGRHIYGFMVDDSVFTLDPRAPKVRDADLGTEGSVRIVGRP